jgi:hypothetical protein
VTLKYASLLRGALPDWDFELPENIHNISPPAVHSKMYDEE